LSSKISYPLSSQLKAELLVPKTEQIENTKRILILICAYNEEKSLPTLLASLKAQDVLVVDDGSADSSARIATQYGANVLSHKDRLGKAVSLSDGIAYALQNSYQIILEIGADAVPKDDSVSRLLGALESSDVGGASCKQIPIGNNSLAYNIDELIWALLAEGKGLQMAIYGTSHLGAVMYAFKPDLVDSVEGSINDDEKVGLSVKMKGYKTIFVENAIVYFDSSSCVGHILQRRQRMYFGHMKYNRSTAPSMQIKTSVIALFRAVCKKPSRLIWSLPALALDSYARLMAWKDVRHNDSSKKYSRWVTTYAKDNSLVIRSSARR